jgi:hypothetical protein
MAKKNGGVLHSDPFNEVGSKDANTPDVDGEGMYWGGWPEINKMHLSQGSASMKESPNSSAVNDIMGGPANGEPEGFAKK